MIRPYLSPTTLRRPLFAAVLAATSVLPATGMAQTGPAPVAPSEVLLKLPRDLTPWGMFMAADVVVKAVVIGLALASLLSWTICFAKAIELATARRRIRRALAVLGDANSLADALIRLRGLSPDALTLAQAAETEWQLSADAMTREGISERVASRLGRLEAAAGRRMICGTGSLANIGATAPFVGLFGTVWGIMNSFIGISQQHTTNLAVVAPGIAEALLATALGLVAAIPAVVMYNVCTRWIAGYRALYADTAAAIQRLVSRDLDRDAQTDRLAERPRPRSAAG